MGGIALSIMINSIPDRKQQSPEGLHKAIWDYAFNALTETIQNEELSEILEEYTAMEAEDHYCEGEWEASDTELSYHFMDCAGNCYMEMDLSLHWFSRILWLNQDKLRILAGEYGYTINFEEVKATAEDKSILFLPYQNQFCSLYVEPDEEYGLFLQSYGEDNFHYKQMSDSDKAYIDRIINEKSCFCGLCEKP
ncbi:MAG: hypothetical protein OEZ36_13805 [Spirochaetota bacterium]|nr:hypothetical protein [Spirochaetota bacterium]